MSENVSFFPLTAFGLTAFFLLATVFMTADIAHAAGAAPNPEASCKCPNEAKKNLKPKFADLSVTLDETDEIAALESVQFALTEVADGATYVWHRSNGRISGFVKPVSSYKSSGGSVCRTATIIFHSGETTKKTEAKACRLPTGVWQIEG